MTPEEDVEFMDWSSVEEDEIVETILLPRLMVILLKLNMKDPIQPVTFPRQQEHIYE
jgi:hypothetical protein